MLVFLFYLSSVLFVIKSDNKCTEPETVIFSGDRKYIFSKNSGHSREADEKVGSRSHREKVSGYKIYGTVSGGEVKRYERIRVPRV